MCKEIEKFGLPFLTWPQPLGNRIFFLLQQKSVKYAKHAKKYQICIILHFWGNMQNMQKLISVNRLQIT
jgi:hypothetical protein